MIEQSHIEIRVFGTVFCVVEETGVANYLGDIRVRGQVMCTDGRLPGVSFSRSVFGIIIFGFSLLDVMGLTRISTDSV